MIQMWLHENEPETLCTEPCPICRLEIKYECSGGEKPFEYFYASNCNPFKQENSRCTLDPELSRGLCSCERQCAASAMCALWEWQWDDTHKVYTCHLFKGTKTAP